jgi:hypothetical protein
MRPVLIAVSLLLLVATALVTGVLASDWPFWQRAWRWHASAPLPPERLPGAHARVEGRGSARDLPLAADPAVTAAVSTLLDDPVTEALLVARDDRLLFEYYGAATSAGQRLDGQELAIVPLVLLHGAAAQRGVGPALDQSIAGQLAEWRQDARGEITPRQLLQGLSGLEGADGFLLNPFGHTARLVSGPNFARAALRFRTAWPAGSHYAANPADAQLAALVLVRGTGQPLTVLLRDWLVEPLGLDSMRVLLDRHRGSAAAHCCVQARARDWLSLGLVVAQGGRLEGRQVVSGGFVREIGTSSPVAPERGLGFELVAGASPGGGNRVLLVPGRRRLLLADTASRTAWLWIGRRDFGATHRSALLAATAAARQSPR